MRSKKILISFTFIIALLLIIPTVNANPVYNPYSLVFPYFISCIFGYFITIGIEYLVGYYFIRRSQLEYNPLLKGIALINLITYPIAQLIVILFYLIMVPDYFIYIIISLEVFIIILEWFLLFNWFKRHVENGVMGFGKINSKLRLFGYSLIANVISFLIGSIIVLPFLPFTSIFSFFYS
ncbi:MAG: hypothetical protein KGD68_10050 [Candidatus Lokiarchaeota archaeon]|nr:hypothetical protein [Candidatus Lokiarchaeota archaeon]